MVNSYQFRHGFSKSQSRLLKILQIIASYPSQENQSSSLILEFAEKKEPAIDLNAELFPWPENDGESETFSAGSTTAAAGGGDFEKSSSEGECDPSAIQTKGSEKSEELNEGEGVIHGGFTAEEVAAAEEGKRKSDNFSILIEAAETVSCESKDKEEKRLDELANYQSEGVEEPPVTAVTAVEEVVAAVRSKRGRSHVLPSRYRDSVIEPVKRRQSSRSVGATKRGKFDK